MSDGAAVESPVFVLDLNSPALKECADVRSSELASGDAARDNFIVGPENRLAGYVIERYLARDGHGYSPLVICGPSGTGKSQLAAAAGRSRIDAVCTTGIDFARELADALDANTVSRFREKYRNAKLFVLEDLERLVGHRAALQELRHTLDALEVSGATAVITSRRMPAQIDGLGKSLRSRLNGGLVVTVSPPGVEARRMILEPLAKSRELSISPAALDLLAERLKLTAAELKGALVELEMTCARQRHSRAFDIDHVRRFLSGQRRKSAGADLKILSAAVAKYFGIKPVALAGASRRRQTVLARSVAIYLARQLTGLSLQAIGKQFGNRDHTTVLHSIRTMESRLTSDAELRAAVRQLEEKLQRA
jgi:chromosomal replication initiator protein